LRRPAGLESSRFVDFIDGTFSDGGVNTYVAADGLSED